MKNIEKLEKARVEYLIKEAEAEKIRTGIQTIEHSELLVTIVFTENHSTRIIFHNVGMGQCAFKIKKGTVIFISKTDDFIGDVDECKTILEEWLSS